LDLFPNTVKKRTFAEGQRISNTRDTITPILLNYWSVSQLSQILNFLFCLSQSTEWIVPSFRIFGNIIYEKFIRLPSIKGKRSSEGLGKWPISLIN